MAQPLKSSRFGTVGPALVADDAAGRKSHGGRLWIAGTLAEEDTSPFALNDLAAWTLRFTPTVSLEPPDGFLLEVGGSLRLFGGLNAIKRALAQRIDTQRLNVQLCAAPTPLAALWLSRCAHADVLEPRTLAGRLAPLPCSVTRWPLGILALLRDMGVRTLGECLRLPRDGFARRVGRRHLAELDEALGRRWAERTVFERPRTLSARMTLGEESADRAVLAAAHARMLRRLVSELRRRQVQIPSLELVFHHRRYPATIETIRLVEPTHEAERLAALLEDRLERVVLPGPVTSVGLRAGPLKPMRVARLSLFMEPGLEEQAAAEVLIERLRSRFGAERVYGLELEAEHRPERAWKKVAAGPRGRRAAAPPVSPWASHRPSWLLPAPQPLGAELGSRLGMRMESGPERIETGWWDGADAARDYYMVLTARGERLWVYRRRGGRREWYLHGIFG